MTIDACKLHFTLHDFFKMGSTVYAVGA
jgi:hypothetical protein